MSSARHCQPIGCTARVRGDQRRCQGAKRATVCDLRRVADLAAWAHHIVGMVCLARMRTAIQCAFVGVLFHIHAACYSHGVRPVPYSAGPGEWGSVIHC